MFWQITQKLWAQRPETVYLLVFDNNLFSWLLPLDGFQFIFLLRDSEGWEAEQAYDRMYFFKFFSGR